MARNYWNLFFKSFTLITFIYFYNYSQNNIPIALLILFIIFSIITITFQYNYRKNQIAQLNNKSKTIQEYKRLQISYITLFSGFSGYVLSYFMGIVQ